MALTGHISGGDDAELGGGTAAKACPHLTAAILVGQANYTKGINDLIRVTQHEVVHDGIHNHPCYSPGYCSVLLMYNDAPR